MFRDSGFVLTQQWNAGVGLGEFALLLDFELSNEIVNSLGSKRLQKSRAIKNKAVELLVGYSI